MATKKKPCNCKKHEHEYGVLWLGGSHISETTKKRAIDYAREGGTVYWLEGHPTPPPCPPTNPGCNK